MLFADCCNCLPMPLDARAPACTITGCHQSNCAARGIKNVLLVGVHVNMCVVGRPFGLRNWVKYGKNAFLVRDLTDSMYNPAMPPQEFPLSCVSAHGLTADPAARRSFVEAVCTAASDRDDPVRVIFTLRDDFLGRSVQGPAAREALIGPLVTRRPELVTGGGSSWRIAACVSLGVPRRNGATSKTPMGPFQNTVFAPTMRPV